MNETVLRELEGIKTGEPFFARNLLIYPIYGPRGGLNAMTLEEAMSSRKIELRESGSVETAVLDYRGDAPLFILDGEEVVGARQNRIFNTAIWAEQPARASVPVSCVEEGRWSGGDEFNPAGTSVYPTLRAIIASSVTRSLMKTGKFKADQSAVWRSISRKLTTLRVSSRTRSIHDAFETLKREIERYVEEIELGDDVVGLAAFAGGKFLSLDVFASNELMRKFKEKLVRGYALDAIELANRSTPMGSFDIEPYLERLKGLRFREYKGAVHGRELRYIDNRFVAKAITDSDGRYIHAALFEVPDEN